MRTLLPTLAAIAIAAVLVVTIDPLRAATGYALRGNVDGLQAQLESLGVVGAIVLVSLILVHAVVLFPAEIPNAVAGLVYDSWTQLAKLYRAGAKGLFDALSLHPYTRELRNVVEVLRRNRAVLDYHRDQDVPILITELSWPSSVGKADSRVRFAKSAFFIDEIHGGDGVDGEIFIDGVFPAAAVAELWPRHFVNGHEFFHRLDVVVEADADNFETLFVKFVVGLFDVGNFSEARSAPGGPEIDEHNFSGHL